MKILDLQIKELAFIFIKNKSWTILRFPWLFKFKNVNFIDLQLYIYKIYYLVPT